MNGIKILGTGRYNPEKTVSNSDFADIIETSDEWISSRTGMKTRHFASNAEPSWYMGKMAAAQALETAGLTPEAIDMVLIMTVTPDFATPSTACIIQRELGAVNAFAFDINVACAGFSYGFDMARRYLADGDIGHILLIGTETLSRMVNYKERATCVLFGDGAGACVVERSDLRFGSYIKSDATGAHCIYTKYKRAENPFIKEQPELRDSFPSEDDGFVHMNGRDVYKFATKAMPEAIEKACVKMGAAPADLDLIIPHQANARIIETAVKNLGISEDSVYINIQNYGNTSSASIPMALDECVREGRLKRGDLLCVTGFGAGLTYGASVLEY